VWAYRGIRLRQVIFGEQLQICQGLGYVGQVGVGSGTIGKVSYSDGGRRKAGGGLLKNLDLGGALLATPVSWELQAAPPQGRAIRGRVESDGNRLIVRRLPKESLFMFNRDATIAP
jgi:hypothetical protein